VAWGKVSTTALPPARTHGHEASRDDVKEDG
jgi:hypothetical protein